MIREASPLGRLTPTQAEVFGVVKAYYLEHWFCPPTAWLARRLEVSVPAAACYVKLFLDLGLVAPDRESVLRIVAHDRLEPVSRRQFARVMGRRMA